MIEKHDEPDTGIKTDSADRSFQPGLCEDASPHHRYFATDVQSNSDTISALREGVGIEGRIEMLDLGAEGAPIEVPVALVTRHDASSKALTSEVKVLSDALRVADLTRPGPRRRAGLVELHSMEALTEYVQAYKTSTTIGFLNARSTPPQLTVVLDYHQPAGAGSAPRWCEDRAEYKLELSRQWKLWLANEGLLMPQTVFADFIDANAIDIGGPTEEVPDAAPAPVMLMTARNLAVHTKGTFERKVNPTTGENTLIAKDEHESTSTKIPRCFVVAIPVFEGAPDKYPVEARLLFRMTSGGPTFTYQLHNRAQCFEHAVEGVRTQVIAEAAIAVYAGAAPKAQSLTPVS